jgi:hypothetical protein
MSVQTSLAEGTKYDNGKERFDLLPAAALFEVAKVYTMGANKYEDRNWEKGIKYGRVKAALDRHLLKWWRGQRYDQEDGQHHLASVVWCALALLHYDLQERKYKMYDNRPDADLPDLVADTTTRMMQAAGVEAPAVPVANADYRHHSFSFVLPQYGETRL